MMAFFVALLTWCAMLWFIWLFYGALKSINKMDDSLNKIAQNLEVLDDMSAILHERWLLETAPKPLMKPKKTRIVRHSDEELAELEKKDKKE